MVEFGFSENYFSISTVPKSVILYKIVNNPTAKMHLSEFQLEKFTRQNMNMNKIFFIPF